MSFFHEMQFYVLLCTHFVAPSFFALAQGEFCAAISRSNLRVCAFNFSVKIKYLVVAVSLQCSCQLLYVHPCLSSHGVCERACERARVCVRARAHRCTRSCAFMDAPLPANLVACSFEGWRNLRGRLKYCAVIGIALSSVSSINVQFSI